MNESGLLVTMRLVDMHRVHPQQDDSKVCSQCGEPVGIYPSGQKALRENPGMTIMCTMCAKVAAGDEFRPAGSLADIVQESRDSKDVSET